MQFCNALQHWLDTMQFFGTLRPSACAMHGVHTSNHIDEINIMPRPKQSINFIIDLQHKHSPIVDLGEKHVADLIYEIAWFFCKR